MAGKNKNKNKNKQNENGQNKNVGVQSQATNVPEVEVKPDVPAQKTQTVSQPEPKAEQESNETRQQESNAVSEELREEPSKTIDLPIESKVEQSNIEAPRQQANTEKQPQPQKATENAQNLADQAQQVHPQVEQQVAKQQSPLQHISQPLQVIEERSGENLISNTASLNAGNTQVESSTDNAAESKVEERATEMSNHVQSDKPHIQAVEAQPAQPENLEKVEVQNDVQKVATVSQQAQSESLPQRQLEVVTENQHKAVSQSHLETLLQKDHQTEEEVVPKYLNNTESFVSIEGQQQRERQYRQAFSNNNQPNIQQKSDKIQRVAHVEQSRSQPDKVQVEVSQQINTHHNEVVENRDVPQTQLQANKQIILQNSAENIEILQHSAPFQVHVERQQVVQNQIASEPICVTESVEVSNLLQSQERPLQIQTQVQKVEVKPEVVEVPESSNNVLDINQPIELVQSVQQPERAPVAVPQKIQNNENIPVQVVDNNDNRIFTLVQSEEIPVGQGEREIKVQVSTELAPTQINVKDSLSFSDLNFSVDRSAGKESISGNQESQQKIQTKITEQTVENKVFESPLPQAVVVEEVIQPNKSIEVPYISLNQQPEIVKQYLSQPVEISQPVQVAHSIEESRPVELLVQQKVVNAAPLIPQVPEVRLEPTEPVSILIQKYQDAPIRVETETIELLKESESNIEQRQELSTSNREAIVQEARIKEQNKELIIPEQVSAPVSSVVVQSQFAGTDKLEPKQEPKKNTQHSSFVNKLLISSSVAVAGGLAWALTKNTNKSLFFGALGLGLGIGATKLLK